MSETCDYFNESYPLYVGKISKRSQEWKWLKNVGRLGISLNYQSETNKKFAREKPLCIRREIDLRENF